MIGRLRRNYSLDARLGDPGEALAALYYDTIVHDPRVLRFLADMVGADRIMMGSDMPFPIGDREPTGSWREAGSPPEAKSPSINGGLAATAVRPDRHDRTKNE